MKFVDEQERTTKKPSYNATLEEYIQEFDKREKIANKIRGFLRAMEKTMREEEEEKYATSKTKHNKERENVEDF